MKFPAQSVLSLLRGGTTHTALDERPPTLPDCPIIDFRPYEEAYKYVCTDFATGDYARLDALRLMHIATHFPAEVIRRVGKRCKNAGKFGIAYLSAAMESEGGEEIDTLRREQEVDRIVAETVPLALPTERFPGKLSERIANRDAEREVANMAKRK